MAYDNNCDERSIINGKLNLSKSRKKERQQSCANYGDKAREKYSFNAQNYFINLKDFTDLDYEEDKERQNKYIQNKRKRSKRNKIIKAIKEKNFISNIEGTLSIQFDQKDDFLSALNSPDIKFDKKIEFLKMPIPHSLGTLQLTIVRKGTGFGKLFPKYYLFDESK